MRQAMTADARIIAKPAAVADHQNGGAGGIRTLDRALQPYNGLANRRLQPLGHSSVVADMPDTGASRKLQFEGAEFRAVWGRHDVGIGSRSVMACYLCNIAPKTAARRLPQAVFILRVQGASVSLTPRRRGATRGRPVLRWVVYVPGENAGVGEGAKRLSSVPGAVSGDEGNLLSTHGYSATGRRAFFVKLAPSFRPRPRVISQVKGARAAGKASEAGSFRRSRLSIQRSFVGIHRPPA